MRDTKQASSLKKKDLSSNLSSTEFMVDPLKEDELLQTANNNNLTEPNGQLNFFQQKAQLTNYQNNALQPISSAHAINSSTYNTPSNKNSIPVVAWSRHENDNLPISANPPSTTHLNVTNKIDEGLEQKQKRQQLFNAKEHQSLMEIPHRELQSVNSPSQQIQTPSNNDLSGRVDNSGNKKISSSVHLSIDLKAIEDKQKRHSILKQRLSEMQDNSQDQSSKAMSNDQQSLIGKLSSQLLEREEVKYLRLSHGNIGQNNGFGLSQYNQGKSGPASSNVTIINNSSSLIQLNNNYGSPNNSNFLNNQMDALKQSTSNNNPMQLHPLIENNISNIQIEGVAQNQRVSNTSESKRLILGEDNIAIQQARPSKIKIQQGMLPVNMQSKKRDRFVSLFIEKLMENTALLRKPTKLRGCHYQMINDLSCPVSVVLAENQWWITTFCMRFLPCWKKLSDSLPMNEPTSVFSAINALIQVVLIATLVYSTSLEMVFNVSEAMSKDFLHSTLSTLCFIFFIMDMLIELNTNVIVQSDEKQILIQQSRQVSAVAYLQSRCAADLPLLILLPFDSQDVFSLHSSKYYLFLRICVFLKLITFCKHFSTIQGFVLSKEILMSALNCLKFIFVVFVFAHVISLGWYGIAAHQDNSWLTELEFADSSWEVQYANSLFWSVCTLTMMGKYQPKSFYELLFACLVMAISLILLFFGFIELKNNFADQQNLTQNTSSDIKKQAQLTSKYLNKKNVTDNLKTRALFFLEQQSKRQIEQVKQINENEAFLSLSAELKAEIRLQSNFKLLAKQDFFRQFFSQRTIDSLLTQVEEEVYLPNEVIFQEKSISDSSIYFVIEGSVGVFQGTKADSEVRKYVQTLNQGQCFGEISFFTGTVRQVTIIAMEYVCVGKIKRENFLSVIAENKDDFERFCMLRDQFMVYEDVNCFGSSCDSCGKSTHLLKDCPLMHLSLDNVKIIHRHIYSADQIRNPAFKRRGPFKIKGSYFMNKDSKRVYGLLLEDSVCRDRMNEIVQMNNYGGEEEEENEEDDEIDDEEDENEMNVFEGPESSRILCEDDENDPKDKILSKETTSDQEEELIRQQITKHSKHSSNTNNNNNNNNNISGGGITNSASNNPHTDNSSQISKANIKSQRKDSSPSQLNPETVLNTKEYKKELTYNTMQTDQQFQGYEFFLQDTTSNNPNNITNTQTMGNLNSLNNLTSINKDNGNSSTINHQTPTTTYNVPTTTYNAPQLFTNPTSTHNATPSIYNMAGIHTTPISSHISTYNVPSSTGEHRKSIPDAAAAAHHIVYEQIQRIANKKLTSQTAPQIYSRTKSFASRKSQKKTNSPEQSYQQQLQPYIQQNNEKNGTIPELVLDQTTSKDYNREVTQSSRISKRQLKFADETQMQTKVSENTFKNNNPTVTSIQLSPYQESMSSRDNSNSQNVPNYILQQFQSLLLKFQFMFRQVMQTQRNNSLQVALDKMNGLSPKEGKNSDLLLEQLNERTKHRSQMSPTRRYDKNPLLQKYIATQTRNPDEWNLEKMRNFKIYFPHNNFSSIYPQILFQQRNRPSPSQAQIVVQQQKPLITLSSNALQTEQIQPAQDYQNLGNSVMPVHALSLIQEVQEPRKTVSTVMSQNLGRKTAYSLTYGVQINQTKPIRQLGSLTSGSSSAYHYQMSPTYSKSKGLQNLSNNPSENRFSSGKYH